jgi:hypothetical protein
MINRAERALRFLAEAKGPVSHSALERAISLSPGGPMRSARTAVSELRQMGIRIPPAEIREGEGWYELQDPEAWAKFHAGRVGPPVKVDTPKSQPCPPTGQEGAVDIYKQGEPLVARRWRGHVPRKSTSYRGQKMTSAEYKRLKRLEDFERDQKQGSLL